MLIDDAALAVAAAEAGAAVVRERFGTRLRHVAKAPGDFATEADLEAEQAILEVLRSARPHDAIVGEESGRTGTTTTGREWLVDPLCGTLNFAAHTMLASVNVALRTIAPQPAKRPGAAPGAAAGSVPGAEAGAGVLAAASADPFAGEVFWTDGERAWLRRDGRDTPLRPDPATNLVDLNLDPPFPNAPGFRAAGLLLQNRFTDRYKPRVISSTLAVAWVAAGRRAAYITDGEFGDSVHFAAGVAICRAAGCTVTNLDGGAPHTGREGLLIAADADTHAALLRLTRS